jgi:hypothetical protein
MVTPKRKTTIQEDIQRLKKSKSKLFFLNDQLHRLIQADRTNNICRAYNYIQDTDLTYLYTEYKRLKKPAYTISIVAKMFNRHPARIRVAINEGHIKKPFILDKLTNGIYYFSEKDIYEIREYFATVHIGRPRNDGATTAGKDIPTKRELQDILEGKEMLYIKTKDGNFVPVWKAEEFS